MTSQEEYYIVNPSYFIKQLLEDETIFNKQSIINILTFIEPSWIIDNGYYQDKLDKYIDIVIDYNIYLKHSMFTTMNMLGKIKNPNFYKKLYDKTKISTDVFTQPFLSNADLFIENLTQEQFDNLDKINTKLAEMFVINKLSSYKKLYDFFNKKNITKQKLLIHGTFKTLEYDNYRYNEAGYKETPKYKKEYKETVLYLFYKVPNVIINLYKINFYKVISLYSLLYYCGVEEKYLFELIKGACNSRRFADNYYNSFKKLEEKLPYITEEMRLYIKNAEFAHQLRS